MEVFQRNLHLIAETRLCGAKELLTWAQQCQGRPLPQIPSMGVTEHLQCECLQRIDQRVQNLGTALPPQKCSQATGLQRPTETG